MRIVWTDEALDDLEEILAYYYVQAGPRIAGSIERRIVEQIEGLPPFPERIRKSARVPDARELVVNKLPYVVFLTHSPD
jgi:plasmid stabilization system protein ParE